MALLRTLRGLFTLILVLPLTFIASTLTWLDLVIGRKSPAKALVFPTWWSRCLCRLAGVRVRVQGQEQIDLEQTYIFAGNHASQYDIFAFQGYFPHDFRWIAKKELFRIPIFGQALHRIGHIPIDRARGRQALKSLDEAGRRIAAGSSVLIFPEGTRSPDGRLREFKTGAVLLALKAGVPGVPVGFNGSYEILPKGGLLPKSGEIVNRIGAPIATDRYRAADKQALATDLHRAVQGLLDERHRA